MEKKKRQKRTNKKSGFIKFFKNTEKHFQTSYLLLSEDGYGYDNYTCENEEFKIMTKTSGAREKLMQKERNSKWINGNEQKDV